ncbi:MAG: glycoside hydrolase family 3 N-terminal domain-containing protein [Verrucomicrobiae bacterium]|nr:glycoside hydrolase family 3 N-terminal domain-containing protein [Verrucomicrobiae bacterium]
MKDIGQRFLVGIPGPSIDSATESLLAENRPGGVILFARNIESAPQVAHLCANLRRLLGPQLLIGLDHEGGRINRLKDLIGAIPSAIQLGFLKDKRLADEHGALTGRLLHELGINLNFAPVLDLWLRPNTDNSVPDRCWSRAPDEVSKLAGAFLAAMQKEGVIGCGKHFIGYGASDKDPHLLLPQVNRTRRQLLREDLAPYRELFPPFTQYKRKKGAATRKHPRKRSSRYNPAHLQMIMLAHAHLRAYHGRQPTPACISSRVAFDLLRNRLRFDGITLTDDLEMGAIIRTMTLPQAVLRCLQAGVDMILISHNAKAMQKGFHAARQAFKRGLIKESLLDASDRRLGHLFSILTPPPNFSPHRFGAAVHDIRRFAEKVHETLPSSMRPMKKAAGA